MQVFATDVLARDVTAAACRETEGTFYVQSVLYENIPGTGADKLPTGRALTCTSFIPLVLWGLWAFSCLRPVSRGHPLVH